LKNKIEVEILGNRYNLKTDSDPEYINEVAKYLNDKINGMSGGAPTVSTSDLSILAALNITDELFKLRKNVTEDYKKLFEKTSTLVEQIDRHLD
jgi:cell division protein ZapA